VITVCKWFWVITLHPDPFVLRIQQEKKIKAMFGLYSFLKPMYYKNMVQKKRGTEWSFKNPKTNVGFTI
jgi:hypothetical protein